MCGRITQCNNAVGIGVKCKFIEGNEIRVRSRAFGEMTNYSDKYVTFYRKEAHLNSLTQMSYKYGFYQNNHSLNSSYQQRKKEHETV